MITIIKNGCIPLRCAISRILTLWMFTGLVAQVKEAHSFLMAAVSPVKIAVMGETN